MTSVYCILRDTRIIYARTSLYQNGAFKILSMRRGLIDIITHTMANIAKRLRLQD